MFIRNGAGKGMKSARGMGERGQSSGGSSVTDRESKAGAGGDEIREVMVGEILQGL